MTKYLDLITEELIETLAEQEHKQWQKWRTDIEERFKIPASKYLKVEYQDLPESEKEEDRHYARESIKTVLTNLDFLISRSEAMKCTCKTCKKEVQEKRDSGIL